MTIRILEKSTYGKPKKRHQRTSKTGKPFFAGKGVNYLNPPKGFDFTKDLPKQFAPTGNENDPQCEKCGDNFKKLYPGVGSWSGNQVCMGCRHEDLAEQRTGIEKASRFGKPGKPYAMQPGRKRGKGAGHIVDDSDTDDFPGLGIADELAERKLPKQGGGQIYWAGSNPTNCDLCGKPFPDVFIDGQTVMGPWGNMCPTCHAEKGNGLGIGKGQKYEKQADGRWLQTAGGSGNYSKEPLKVKEIEGIPVAQAKLTPDMEAVVKCPRCKTKRNVEPDADYEVTCEGCGKKYKVESPL